MVITQKVLLLHRRKQRQNVNGEMAERFNAPVLKTDEGNTSGGSNPSLSAFFFINPQYIFGAYRSPVSVSALGAEGREFESLCPDYFYYSLYQKITINLHKKSTPKQKKMKKNLTFGKKAVYLGTD